MTTLNKIEYTECEFIQYINTGHHKYNAYQKSLACFTSLSLWTFDAVIIFS